MKKFLLSLMLLCCGMAYAADFPALYLAGAFNGWSLDDGKLKTVQPDANGVYTVNLDIADGQNEFKMSFTYPAGNSIEEKWGNFNKTSFGLGNSEEWKRGIYDFKAQESNSKLPDGQWVITVYYNDKKVALSAPGETVPVPGDDNNNDEPGKYPSLYTVGEFNGWQPGAAVKYSANKDGIYTLNNVSGTFKMSFSEPTGQGQELWTSFDEKAFGISPDQSWTPGIFDLKYHADNSSLPEGTWVVTVYYDEQKIALSAPGAPVPQPGDQTPVVSGTLPVLYINVYNADGTYNNEVISYDLGHKNYFDGVYWLDMNGCDWMGKNAKSLGSKEEPLVLQIKARGNYTRTGFAKKPFKLKLDKKQSMLGMTKSKHYAILAHADDDTGFLRNFTGFELGKRIGLPWTPSQQPVEVVINGNYRGLYFLTESIRIDEDRVNIREGKDNETEKEYISGGYIVELDNYDEDFSAQIQMDEKYCAEGHNYDKLRVTFDTPEVYSDLQRRFITDQFTAMNNAVGVCNRSDELWRYMDLDDAARYYLVNEIVSHVESYHGSTYLFRDHGNGEKWHFSPLWDMGNAFNGGTNCFLYQGDPFGNTWIPSIRENKKFNDKVKATWLWFMSNNFDGIEEDMSEYIEHIKDAAALDYSRWQTSGISLPSKNPKNLSESLGRTINHLRAKTNWLKGQFGDYTATVFTEPERDNTEAAPLPDYAQTGVEDIIVNKDLEDGMWYNLQGQPVSNPVKGNLYITSKGVIRY